MGLRGPRLRPACGFSTSQQTWNRLSRIALVRWRQRFYPDSEVEASSVPCKQMTTVSEYVTSDSVSTHDKNVNLSSVTVFLWEWLWPTSIPVEKENKQNNDEHLREVLKFLVPLNFRADKMRPCVGQIFKSRGGALISTEPWPFISEWPRFKAQPPCLLSVPWEQVPFVSEHVFPHVCKRYHCEINKT